MPEERRWRSEDVALWLALGVCFSPVIVGLVAHWVDHPWARYSVPFAFLLAWCIWRGDEVRELRWTGIALIAVGILIEVLSILAGVTFTARPALGLAVVGLILMRGTASLRVALLAFWVIPVPSVFLRLGGGEDLAKLWFELGGALLSPAGWSFSVEHRHVVLGAERLRSHSEWGGGVLLLGVAGLAWYWGARTAQGWRRTIQGAAVALLLALPLQLCFVIGALALLASTGAESAGRLLDYGPWLSALAASVWWTERRGGVDARQRGD